MQLRKWGTFVLALGLGISASACDEDDPFAPVDSPSLTAQAAADDAIDLSWNAVQGANTYSIQRKVNTGSFQVLTSGLTTTTYTDTDVGLGNSYTYVVEAVGNDDTEYSLPQTVMLGLKEATLSGRVDADRTLSADTTYHLRGTVTVNDGATLTIEPGTLILGDVAFTPTALIVQQGGRIDARGTVDAPIVFTSSNPAGSRSRGDWGGVVINGRSICNFPDADDCVAEGFPGQYGANPPVLDDDSGIMTYVRIEYAGYEVSLGNELNALTLNGVGSGTELHHIQTHYGLDDGFEWFGGTVDLKYALATGISDDSFDYSTGWAGRGQFWIAVQDPDDADNGFEVDNNEQDYTATPRTSPTIYNITLVGKGPTGGTAGESTHGLLLRRGTAGTIANAIVIGFGTAGLDIDNAETLAECTSGGLVVSNSIFFDNLEYLDSDDDSDAAGDQQYEDTCTSQAAWAGLLSQDPQLGDPYNRAAPDLRPATSSPAASAANAATPPSDGWFDSTDYIGAVDPVATAPLWYEGWTTFATN